MLESTFIMLVLYSYYRLFLHRETWLQFNRFYLLGTVLLAFVLPLLQIPVDIGLGVPQLILLDPVTITPNDPAMTLSQRPVWLQIMGFILVSGMVVAFTSMIYRLIRLFRFVWNAEVNDAVEKKPGYTVVLTHGKVPTSSFFRYLFWDNTAELSLTEEEQVLAHEQCHIRQGHSIDLLLMELVLVVAWFQPLLYLIRRDLVQTHEFLADRSAVGPQEKKAYSRLIIRQMLGINFSLAHSFFESPAKARIRMLQRIPNMRMAVAKYLWLAPLAVFLFFLIGGSSWKRTQAVSVETDALPVEKSPPAVITTEESIPDIQAFEFADESPRPLNMREIQRTIGYPQVAREAGIEGSVVVRILVDTDGSYLDHKIINSVHPVLDEPVELSLPQLRFTPAVKDGNPIKFWVNIPFNFKLIQ